VDAHNWHLVVGGRTAGASMDQGESLRLGILALVGAGLKLQLLTSELDRQNGLRCPIDLEVNGLNRIGFH